ncbi:MAG: CocE/NonD family hydrolase [Verrucomicrobia bacterium]|nr:CocE/NonD family hydrolase [Verrucomicrobiota bacterium]
MAVAVLCLAPALAQQPATVIVERNVMVPMRDGVKLATFIRRPQTDAKVPAILSRTPYNAKLPGSLDREAVRPGDPSARFAMVFQDTRGRYASEGEFYPMKNEANDGYDAVEWVARQPWCDGNVAMNGGSYVGFTQLAAAMERPPHLRAIWAQVPPADLGNGTFFQGGTMRLELAQGWMIGQAFKSKRVLRNEVLPPELDRWQEKGQFSEWCWHLPLRDAGAIALGGPGYVQAWNDVVASWDKPRAWDAISALKNIEKLAVPVMVVGGWYDIFSQGNLDLWAALRARGGSDVTRRETRLIMGPWIHSCRGPTGAVSFPKADLQLQQLQVEWFDRWLCGKTNAVVNWPVLRYYEMNGRGWVDAAEFPPKEAAPAKFYLTFDAASRRRALAAQPPAADAAPSAFTYDPTRPVPTLGGNNLTIVRGIQDHWDHSQRADVVGFETAPLEKDLTVAGRVRVHLVAASSALDTDFTAMLLDVKPGKSDDERAMHANVLDGIVRSRFRHGREKAGTLEPDKPVELDMDLWSTAYTFKAGNRIRLNISSSNFPRFDRNLNTADACGHGTSLEKAENRVFHDASHASFVELPVVQ